MAVTVRTFEGTFSGTEEVELIPAPGFGARHTITNLTVFNRDTVSHTPTLERYRSVAHFTSHEDEEYLPIVPDIELATGEQLRLGGIVYVIDDHDTITGVLAAVKTTTDVSYWGTYLRESRR